jgi:hypothetical protein
MALAAWLVVVALLWLLSVQFYTGCESGCSGAREAIAALRYPLAVLGVGLALLAVVRLFLRLGRR